jgi:hypothetical protein
VLGVLFDSGGDGDEDGGVSGIGAQVNEEELDLDVELTDAATFKKDELSPSIGNNNNNNNNSTTASMKGFQLACPGYG